MEPQLVGQRPARARSAPSAATSPCSTGCAATGFTGSKEGCAEGECGACAVLVARARRLPTVDAAGPRSTPASCRRPASPARRSITAEGLGQPGQLHPVQREMAASRRLAVRLLHARASSARWPPSTTAPTAPTPAERPTGARARPRARAERLRPARAQRQPVPVHRLPPDPRRRLRPRRPGRRPTRCSPGCAGPLPPPVATDIASEPGPIRPAGRPRRGARPARRAPRRPPGRRLDRLGRRAQHPPRPRRADDRASTGSTSCATLSIGDDPIDIGAALTPVRDRAWRSAGRVPLLDQLFPQFASRLIRNGATLGGNLGTGIADRRHPAGAARPRRVAGPRLARRRARGRAGRLLHRLPADGQAAGRADQDGPDPAAARADHRLPQDRQAALRRHLERRRRVRAAARRPTRTGRSSPTSRSASAASPRRRCGRRATEAALIGRPWTRATVAAAADGPRPARARR